MPHRQPTHQRRVARVVVHPIQEEEGQDLEALPLQPELLSEMFLNRVPVLLPEYHFLIRPAWLTNAEGHAVGETDQSLARGDLLDLKHGILRPFRLRF